MTVFEKFFKYVTGEPGNPAIKKEPLAKEVSSSDRFKELRKNRVRKNGKSSNYQTAPRRIRKNQVTDLPPMGYVPPQIPKPKDENPRMYPNPPQMNPRDGNGYSTPNYIPRDRYQDLNDSHSPHDEDIGKSPSCKFDYSKPEKNSDKNVDTDNRRIVRQAEAVEGVKKLPDPTIEEEFERIRQENEKKKKILEEHYLERKREKRMAEEKKKEADKLREQEEEKKRIREEEKKRKEKERLERKVRELDEEVERKLAEWKEREKKQKEEKEEKRRGEKEREKEHQRHQSERKRREEQMRLQKEEEHKKREKEAFEAEQIRLENEREKLQQKRKDEEKRIRREEAERKRKEKEFREQEKRGREQEEPSVQTSPSGGISYDDYINYYVPKREVEYPERILDQQPSKNEKKVTEKTISIHICGTTGVIGGFKELLVQTFQSLYNTNDILIFQESGDIGQDRYTLKHDYYKLYSNNPEKKLFDVHIRINSGSLAPLPDEHENEMRFLKENSYTKSALYIQFSPGMMAQEYVKYNGSKKIFEKGQFSSGICFGTIFEVYSDFFFFFEMNGRLIRGDSNPACAEVIRRTYDQNMKELCKLINTCRIRKSAVRHLILEEEEEEDSKVEEDDDDRRGEGVDTENAKSTDSECRSCNEFEKEKSGYQKKIKSLEDRVKELESQLEKQKLESQLETEMTVKFFERVSKENIKRTFKNRTEMGILRLSLHPHELEINKKVLLGSGRFGNVHPAKLKIERDIVIKDVKYFNPYWDEKMNNGGMPLRKDVLNEFKIQSSFLRKEVLRTFGMTEPFGKCRVRYIMEKMDLDVFKFVKEKKLMLNEKFLLMKKLAKCVYCLHAESPPIVHRDIKAENFLYRRKGKIVKICDFGLSRGLRLGQSSVWKTDVAGTAGWMAPETKKGIFSVYSDIFALGVTFWEVLFERKPFVRGNEMHMVKSDPGCILPDLESPEGLFQEFKDLLKWMWKEKPPSKSEKSEEEGENEDEEKVFRPDINGVLNWFEEMMADMKFVDKLGFNFPPKEAEKLSEEEEQKRSRVEEREREKKRKEEQAARFAKERDRKKMKPKVTEKTISIHICGTTGVIGGFKELLVETFQSLYNTNDIFIYQESGDIGQTRYTLKHDYYKPNSDIPEQKLFDVHIRINSGSLAPMPDENEKEMRFLKDHSYTKSALYIQFSAGMQAQEYMQYGSTKILKKQQRQGKRKSDWFSSGICFGTSYEVYSDFFFFQTNRRLIRDNSNPACAEIIRRTFDQNMRELCELINTCRVRKSTVRSQLEFQRRMEGMELC